MQADFNPFSAQQREHEEMMIRHLEDDEEEEEEEDYEDVNTKKHMFHRRLQKRKRFKAPAL